MVTIPPERVADALHVETDDLPTGYSEDITSAEYVIETHVEPNADAEHDDAVETTGVYVAAAFIAGTEGDAPLSSVDTETASIKIDVGNMSPESRDFWARAMMVDPTNGLKQASDAKASTAFSLTSVSTRGRPEEEY